MSTLSLPTPASNAERGFTVELNCTFVRSTADAVLVDTGAGQKWLPRAHCTVERGMFGAARVHMPPWLAREKGLTADVADERQGVLL